MVPISKTLTDEGRLSPDQLVSEALHNAAQLRDTLDDERRALAGRDPNALTSIFERKTQIAAQLDAIETRRQALCGPEQDTPRAFRQHLSPAMQPRWDEYCDKLLECREINAVNGRLARLGQDHVRRALAVLRGQHSVEPGLYQADGGATSTLSAQELGRA